MPEVWFWYKAFLTLFMRLADFLPLLLMASYVSFLLSSPPSCALFHTLFPHLYPVFPFSASPRVTLGEYLDSMCSPSCRVSGAKANVWLKCCSGLGLVSATRWAKNCWGFTGAWQQLLGHLCPPQVTTPPLSTTRVTGTGHALLPSSLGQRSCHILFPRYGDFKGHLE